MWIPLCDDPSRYLGSTSTPVSATAMISHGTGSCRHTRTHPALLVATPVSDFHFHKPHGKARSQEEAV